MGRENGEEGDVQRSRRSGQPAWAQERRLETPERGRLLRIRCQAAGSSILPERMEQDMRPNKKNANRRGLAYCGKQEAVISSPE
jgi:uncharacterized OB-fold protein